MSGVMEKSMFGSRAYLMDGNLLLAAGTGGVLLRIGPDNMAAALSRDGVEQAVMGSRTMNGWLRMTGEAFASDAVDGGLLAQALDFVRGL